MKKIFIIVALSTYVLVGCNNSDGKAIVKKEPVISDSLSKMITIDTVRVLPIGDQLKLSGEIGYDENSVVKIFPNSSGQVLKVAVSFGDYVHKGQTLAIIKSADVAGNYSDLASAESDVKIAKRQYDNAKSLYESGISSQREYEEAKENFDKATAVANKIKSMIRINGGGHTNAGGTYTVVAPANGYIVEKKIADGAFIRSDMADNLFTISELKNVWVWANVYETDIAKVKQGYLAQVTTLAYPDKVFIGTVDKVNDLIDPANKSLRVRITLHNDSLLLKPEMFANVVIVNKEAKTALAIPSTAVVTDNGKNFAVVYNSNFNVKVKPIQVLKVEGNTTYIADGLEPGEKLISQNQLLVYDAIAGK
ncbi:MAG TPA: efflux RND transporter periplasmic adaptor subunit [Flavisolibacter sp.]|jgi:cobalt-zinc-cadmium efflux system membrane fusion protein|nr:efflux RND transporter periplasmic adaptor subunit [Flavisolibacter sp.]